MPQMIREYEILGRIGKGGMATVYLAKHIHLNTTVAIKILNEEYSENESVRERFLNEARLLNTLKHPNIVEQKEFFQENGHFVLTMEYVSGRSLDEMIGQDIGPIPWEKAIPLFIQILAGIGFAHNKGVIHRDIKPANILISKEGKVKIADLGIAKVAGSKGKTKTGAKIGTIYYMSPEQVQGREADYRSDIYSLGMTFFETMAGRLPFGSGEETSEFEIMSKIVSGSLPDPREFYPHIPQWAVAAIEKATAVNPNERFQNCNEFAAYLTNNAKSLDMQTVFWSDQVAELGSMQLQKQTASPFELRGNNTPTPLHGSDTCPQCGCMLEKDMEFCMKCGTDLQKECPDCGKKIRWFAEFCPKCGVNIKEEEREQKQKLEHKVAEQRRRSEETERYEEAQRIRRERKQEEEKKNAELIKKKREQKRIEEKKEREKREKARRKNEKRIEAEKEAFRQRKLKEEAEKKLRRQFWMKKNWWKITTASVLFFALIITISYINSDGYKYSKAVALFEEGNWSEAALVFEGLNEFRDSEHQALECYLAQTKHLVQQNNFASATEVVKNNLQGEGLITEELAAFLKSSPDIVEFLLPTSMTFVSIPSGTFLMGSPSSESNRDSNESRHTVNVGSFELMSTEVTQGMWEEVMGTNPSHDYGVGSSYPVYNVSWDDCQDFIEKLNDLDRKFPF